jgi:nicotinate phosphoribosyltransferase
VALVSARVSTLRPALRISTAYQLQEYAGRPCPNRSEGKATWPGRKQVFRTFDRAGYLAGDVLTLDDDRQKASCCSIRQSVAGKRLDATVALSALRNHAARELGCFAGTTVHARRAKSRFEVKISGALQLLARTVDQESR